MRVEWVRVAVIFAILYLAAGKAAGWRTNNDAPPDEGWPARGLRDVASVFPKSQLLSVLGSKNLDEPIGQVLDAIAREDRGAGSQVAFVLDRSFPDDFERALLVALANNRDKAPAGNYALISCGYDRAGWSARIEVPLKPEVYSVLRAPAHIRWTLDGTKIAAAWKGLAKVTELSWKPGSPGPHVIVLTDDRSYPDELEWLPKPPPPDLYDRAAVSWWAKAHNATLHVIRLTPEPPPEPRYEGQTSPRMEVKTVAGLFRNQHYAEAKTEVDLARAIEDAVTRAGGAGGPVDLVIVDNQRRGMDGPRGVLSSAGPTFQRFCAAPGHRLALVRWGNATKPVVEFGFTTDAAKIPRAAARVRGTPRSTALDPLFDALDVARRLAWAPNARKAILVVSHPYLEIGKVPMDAVLDWAGDNNVAVTIVGP